MKDIEEKDLQDVSGGNSPDKGCFPSFPFPDYPTNPGWPLPEQPYCPAEPVDVATEN